MDDVEISIVGIEDLILSKLFWAKDSLSEMHLGDVKNLLTAAKNTDVRYLEEWVLQLGLEDIYKKVKHE